MSEEILKALMQLFAIISKQDDGFGYSERNYVQRFLRSQLNENEAEKYLTLFDDFSEQKHSSNKFVSSQSKNLTSVSDSVKTLKICKNINKTLNTKQKVIVLVRLFELLKAENKFTEQRLDIIFTAGKVFRIKPNEIAAIEHFVENDSLDNVPFEDLVVLNYATEDPKGKDLSSRAGIFDGNLFILNVKIAGILFLRYSGHDSIYLNGLPINKNQVYLFANGSSLKFPKGKPIYYSDVIAKFLNESQQNKIDFVAKDVTYKFPNGNVGLNAVNISEKQGQLISIMGASGSGKTTLLNLLAGISPPTSGSLTLNGVNVHESNSVKRLFGYIPQDDLLVEELSVFDNLFYSAKLSMDEPEEEIKVKVEKTLKNLGLYEIRHLKVGNPLNKTISGGQRKRLNIALELIREPALLFVDEPTSGLSSRDSENVIDLLRELSLRGQLIFVVIHQPSSDIYKKFDKVILMDTGGYQIFYGNPIEALVYLKELDHQVDASRAECHNCGNVNPELIFNIVEAKVVDEYGNESDERKVPSKTWHKLFKEGFSLSESSEEVHELPEAGKLPAKWKQFSSFFLRDFFAKIANKQYMLIISLIAPILALFSSIIIRYQKDPNSGEYHFFENDNIPAYIFISILISLFIGLIVSAEEIYKDRKILKRESLLNLSRMSYLLSKIAILFIISSLQMLLLVILGNTILEIKGMTFQFWAALFSIACLANLLGLNLSSTFNSVVTIYIMIPLIIIPQMILGGAMFSYDKLNQLIGGGIGNKVPYVAELMPTKWIYEGLAVNLFMESPIESELFEINMALSNSNFKTSFLIPELKGKYNALKTYASEADSIKNQKLAKDFDLLRSTLQEELLILGYTKNNLLDTTTINTLNSEAIKDIKLIIKRLDKAYKKIYKRNLKKKQSVMDRIDEAYTEEGGLTFVKKNYTNEYLESILRKKFSESKMVEYNNKLIQIKDPIYLYPTPTHPLDFSAHFYAPKKHFAGYFISTYLFNILVIWAMNLSLVLFLYFDLFKKIGSKLSGIKYIVKKK